MTRTDSTAERTTDTHAEKHGMSGVMHTQEAEVDLVELLFQLIAHIRLIILLAVVGAAAAAAYTQYFVTPAYEATAKLYVINSGDSAINLSDLQIGSYLASDYIEVFKTWEVHEMVIVNLGLPYTYAQLQHMLTIENPTDTRLLYITVQSPDAKEAAAIANEYASVAIAYIADTMATEKPNIMSKALAPSNPSSPNRTQNILIGFAVGLLVAVGWVTLRFVMDDKIKSVDDIRRYANLPVLAVVPTLPIAAARKQHRSKARDQV